MRNPRLSQRHLLLPIASAAYAAALLAWLAAGDRSWSDGAFAAVSSLLFAAAVWLAVRSLRGERGSVELAERRLRQRDETFRSLFELSPVAISLLDRNGSFVSANAASASLSGYSQDELAGKTFSELVHVNHMNETMRRMQQALEGEVQTFPSVLVFRGGHAADVQVTAMPVRDEARRVTGVLAMIEDLTKKRQSEERMKQLAYYDDLTGLPNRRLFLDLVAEQLVSAGTRARVYVVLLNVNRFKVVNGSLGHDLGDMLLLQLADRLHRSVSEQGGAARLEGDEFGLLYRDDDGSMSAEGLAKLIERQLEEPFLIQEYSLHITASIGIAAGFRGDDESALLKHAGIALSKAKESGKNGYELYTEQMDEAYVAKFTLENDLRRAIQEGEFLLLFQPQVHILTGKVVGAEALLRWRHAERGVIPPGEFIPVAEETGLIVPLSEWVIREACLRNREWQREGLPHIPVSVNLSVRQFLQPNLTERVASILNETGLSPAYLELEITESMTMDVEFATEALLRLKRLGLRISIDDFGTGYSSLNYLKNFPVDKLKIDRSFVRDIMLDPNDAAIVRTIITMAHHLNQTVIAEGVETEEQLAYLRTYGCDEMQGFLYSPPVPPDELRRLLTERKV